VKEAPDTQQQKTNKKEKTTLKANNSNHLKLTGKETHQITAMMLTST